MSEPTEAHLPLGRAAECSRQLEAAVRFICDHHALPRLSLIGHSWGSIVAGELAGRCPELIERLVSSARSPDDAQGKQQRLTGWRLVSLQDQWQRFVADVPAGAAPVLSQRHFDEWGERYLDSDPASRTRTPAAVKVPSGAFQDIYGAWAGELAYAPAKSARRSRSSAANGRHVPRCRCALAVRPAVGLAVAARYQDRPRHPP